MICSGAVIFDETKTRQNRTGWKKDVEMKWSQTKPNIFQKNCTFQCGWWDWMTRSKANIKKKISEKYIVKKKKTKKEKQGIKKGKR